MPFEFQPLSIPDVILITPRCFNDPRGFFLETFKKSEFVRHGIACEFVQDNFSHSQYGVLRGLHYQNHPMAQAKLVTVLNGEVFDVAVDLRRGSPTFGQWVGAYLRGAQHQLLYIPEGFAHGFCVLSQKVDFLYKVSKEYSPQHDRGIRWDDPEIGIQWPIENPILSEKDKQLPFLKEADYNFHFR